ncbi:alkaline phosphatase [Conexibacter sp. SYSU D00693]|uniref:alkaline phosphatase n=1 Tax=Conexibacter sp. SYSU D00693 TaxID=2812560 RepID=UPI00196AA06A|nr:alkaline phosphatase [Conexibacter sp. SYSU D00693]
MKFTRTTALAAAVTACGVAVTGVAVADKDGRSAEVVAQAKKEDRARNVILLIGDGMDERIITATRDYQVGADGKLPGLDGFLLTGDKTTHSVEEAPPNLPDYDPDSASTGTAWATGFKTSDARIDTVPGDDTPYGDPENLFELAERKGLRTGNVTTADVTDATPAVQMAHVPARGCQGPQNMAACPTYRRSAGGPGSISEQSITKGIEVIFGGGSSRYAQTADDGETVLSKAEKAGYRVLRTRSDLQSAPLDKPLLGLFDNQTTNGGNLEVEWDGIPASNPPTGPATGQVCNEANPARPASEPSLVEMERKALQALTRPGRGAEKGFFLQVEGASIDKREHAAEPCEAIGETVAFDRAVKLALDFAKERGDTLVVVTGDHAHSTQIVQAGTNPPGCSSRLRTKEDAVLQLNFATSTPCPNPSTGAAGASQQHEGSEVRVVAYGPSAGEFVGLTDDTDHFDIFRDALDLPAQGRTKAPAGTPNPSR